MKATRNNFVKGLKNEKDPLSVGKDEYVDALNVRIESDEGGSSYSIINVKGNRYDTTIPDVPPMVVIVPVFSEIEDGTNTLSLSVVPTITINGNIITGSPVYANDRSALVLFRNLQNAFETDPVFATYNLQVARQGLRIVITSQTDTIEPAIGSSFVSSTAIAGMTSDSQTIIGWTHSDVSFYILTTDDRSDEGGHGAIWKLTYDSVDFTYSWSIRYSSPDLMLTTKYPVANPSGIEISDETEEIVRIAWTDNYNPLRFFNADSPNSIALTVGMLSVHDSQTNPIPIFKDVVTGGSLKNGTYQIAYRLRSDDASYTLISQHSNVINLTEDAEHAAVNIRYYEGSDSDDAQNAGKALTFLFNIPETAYSFLEVFTLFRNTQTAVPEVRLVSEIPIYANKIEYTISGAEEAATFTYEEFQNLYTPFTHCKTITQKDSILFAGNVRSDDFDVEFDPRAYGHKSIEQGSDSYITTPQETYPSDQTIDAINPDFDEYRYQANGTTYGGQGPNVSYKFSSRFHFGDSLGYETWGAYKDENEDHLQQQRFLPTWEPPNDIVTGATASGLGSGGQETYEGMMTGHISPWESANWRGYKRGEVYRFAFVPIKNGQEGRAKWIADIKIPHYTDDPDDQVDQWYNGYEIVRRHPSDWTPSLNPIGIIFDIDVSSIAGEIDGYKIKRVKREDRDKTILGSGIVGVTQPRYNADFPGSYLDGNVQIREGAGLGELDPYHESNARPRVTIESNQPKGEAKTTGRNYAFYSPDMTFKDSFESKGGDELRVHSILHPTINPMNNPAHEREIDSYVDTVSSSNTQINKLYGQLNVKDFLKNMTNLYSLPDGARQSDIDKGYITLPVNDARLCDWGASVELEGSQVFHNRTHITNGDHVGSTNTVGPYQRALGTKCLAIASKATFHMSTFIGYGTIPYDIGFQEDTTFMTNFQGNNFPDIEQRQQKTKTQLRRYADYYRPLKAQYGGNTYAARSKNIYIDTGTYKEVSSTTTNTSVNVFGGDTYINILGITTLTRNIKAWLENRGALEDEFTDNHTGVVSAAKKSFNYIEFFPVESGVNTDLRQGKYYNKSFIELGFAGLNLMNHAFTQSNPPPIPANLTPNWDALDIEGALLEDMMQVGEDYIYNFAYSNEEDLQPSFPEPLSGEEVDDFPTRIYASDVKTSGEIVNSWRRFRTQSYIEINSSHGPINAVVNNLDRIIALQDDAMGTASVNERQVAQTQSGEATILGNSGVLPRFDYITKHTGSRHQFGIVMSPNSMYFYDVSDGVLYRFDGQKITPISQVGELNQFFYNNFRGELLRNDNPIADADLSLTTYNPIGITGTYDYRFNEALFTFHTFLDGQYVAKTLAFNENASTFTSFYSFTPTVYLNDRENVFSPGKPDQNTLGTPNPQQHKLYIHNKGERGVFYDNAPADSYVEMIVSEEAPSSKIFTNLEWNSEVYDSAGNNTPGDTVDSITISNEYQTLPVLTTYQRRFRTWRATIPREVPGRARLRGHYMRMRYTFNNSDNRKFVLSGVTTIYDMTAY